MIPFTFLKEKCLPHVLLFARCLPPLCFVFFLLLCIFPVMSVKIAEAGTTKSDRSDREVSDA